MFTADNGTNTSITSRWDGQLIKGGKGGMTDMGTHVPFVASWKGTSPSGVIYEDLIEFTDFYATLAEAAGHVRQADDPIDGRSFFPRLRGLPGNPREWVLCHYQPYWNKTPGQFARNSHYKLYRDGRYYHVPVDLTESHDLGAGSAGDSGERVRQQLQAMLDLAPPAPTGVGNRSTKERPTFSDWRNLVDPND